MKKLIITICFVLMFGSTSLFALPVSITGEVLDEGPLYEPVFLTGYAVQEYEAQDFAFIFYPVGLSDGTDGIFRLHARGDYSGPGSHSGDNEYITWHFDWMLSGQASPYLGSNIIKKFPGGNDIEWDEEIIISGEDLRGAIYDGQITILLDLSRAVSEAYGPSRFVEVELSYNIIPEPASAVLIIGGATILSLRRRK